MFPTEKIVKAFYMARCAEETDEYMFLFFSPCVELYVAKGSWLVFQTESGYVLIGADGVSFTKRLDDYRFPEYDFWDYGDENEDPPIVALETTLFVGERLLRMEKTRETYRLIFDHFSLETYPFSEDRQYTPGFQSCYIPIPCFERHIERKCSCGGQGQVMLDRVDDFFVRCEKCHRATWSQWHLPSVIEEWNNGDTPITVNTGNEYFTRIDPAPVRLIAMSREKTLLDDELYICNSVILVMGENTFLIRSQCIGKDMYDFLFERRGGFNSEIWPYQVAATSETPIIYLGRDAEKTAYPVLRFQIGGKQLIITADDHGSMMFGWVNRNANEEYTSDDGKSLFNQIY